MPTFNENSGLPDHDHREVSQDEIPYGGSKEKMEKATLLRQSNKKIKELILIRDGHYVSAEMFQMETEESPDYRDISFDDVGMDSLDQVEFMMEIEKEYGVSIPDEEAARCKIFGDAYDLLQEKLKGKQKSKVEKVIKE